MDYSKIMDLDNITLKDCDRFYKNGKSIILNDGRVVNVMEEKIERNQVK